MEDYSIVSSKEMYNGKIFKVLQDEIVLPNGKIATRDIVEHRGAAAVVPVDKDGNIIFVRQHRHPASSMILEIPAGKLEINEDPFDCASRELEEEIGYKSDNIQLMFKTYMAVGYSTELIYIYLATNLIKTEQNLDEDEFVEIETYSLSKALTMIKNGEIVDSKTIASILYYKEFCLE